jgi:hypothetical protein
VLPFHSTVEVDTKPLPLTVSVNGELPAVTLPGETEVMLGTGLLEPTGVPPPPPPPPQPKSKKAAVAMTNDERCATKRANGEKLINFFDLNEASAHGAREAD